MMISDARILVVDDEAYNIQLILGVLIDYNPDYVIYQANAVDMALKITQKVHPDLIITDWDMPGKTGIELIRSLKEHPELKQIPVIMATGIMTSSEHLKNALEVGAVDYVKKPIDETELIARVNSVLRLAETQGNLIKQKDSELMQSTLALVKNNEFNQKISEKLKKVLLSVHNTDAKRLINEVISDLQEKVQVDDTERFDTSFNAVYEDFYKNLLSDFPDLTQSELKLSAYLKLGLSSKDIASVLYISKDSVKTARSRLRKKLHIDSGTNLQSFLAKY